MKQLIESVSDTARWVAIYRAEESERRDALFRDPYARELGGPKGEAIAKSVLGGKRAGWAVAIRTHVIDEYLRRLIAEGSIDMVVNLAAGLDTRPFRMDLPSTFTWVEADLPEINAYKTTKMQFKVPRCQLERIDADLSQAWARTQLFDHLRAKYKGKSAVVLTEGLLMYLTEVQVLALTEGLNGWEQARYWVQDYLSPRMKEQLNKRIGAELSRGRVPFHFSPERGSHYFAPYGWTTMEARSIFLEGIRLKRFQPCRTVMKFLYDLAPPKMQDSFRQMMGVSLLRRT